MSNTMEMQVRKVAVLLTALVVLQIVWSIGRLVMLSEPDPIAPAQTSLRVGDPGYSAVDGEELAADFTARPLFWQGRQAHVPSVREEGPVQQVRRSEKTGIKDVKLLGVYRAGKQSGIIILNKGKRQRLLLNETVGNWTFSMMSADGAIFESGDESRVLELQHAIPKSQQKAQPRVVKRETRTDNKGE